jgi:prevent-host-death family protein
MCSALAPCAKWSHNVVMSKTMSATKFKAHVLALLERVAKTGEKIVVTKRGKPMAELRRTQASSKSKRKSLKGSVRILGDIISPIDVKWESDWK